MSNIFVAKPLKNASIETAILLESRYDQKYAYIYIYIYIYYICIYIVLFKRGMSIGSVCTFISAHGFLNATCPLDPGFDAMYLVTVQWRQN